ncbi:MULTISPECIES: hypothetical protein [Microbulbifer]|uniref:hypothetical protein n=1 Tax=Microbulbifer TaxID=48073 RepID=UPI001E3AA2E0|nr:MULTISPECIES: hypothetical protein [Microbulbifer]UHQ56254.1 hypothetical protein LVE68_04540 [Microbulbifer sp. YPW16]
MKKLLVLFFLCSQAIASEPGISLEKIDNKVDLGEYLTMIVDTVKDSKNRIRFFKAEELYEYHCYEDCGYIFLTSATGPDLPYEFFPYRVIGAKDIKILPYHGNETWRDYGFECGWRQSQYTELEIKDYTNKKRNFALVELSIPASDEGELNYNSVKLQLMEKRSEKLPYSAIPPGCATDLVG